MSFDSTIHAKAVDLTKLCYEMAANAGSGHPTSCASLAHLVTVLMYQHMRWEPANPGHASADRLVLSEGHSVPIIYAACADLGAHMGRPDGTTRAMTRDDARTLRMIDSPIEGHPNPMEGFPFFDVATGSLGQGLSCSAGLAAAAGLDDIDKRIYCIIGDGESREGQVWEALDFIADFNLKAVCPIFNCNAFGQSDPVSAAQTADAIVRKLEAFGCNVLDIDGHQPTEIADALRKHVSTTCDPQAKPMAIVARTVKGWGSPSQHGMGHHGKPATDSDLEQALAELDETALQVGAAADTTLQIADITAGKPAPVERGAVSSLSEAAESGGLGDKLRSGAFSTRRAYGLALKALGHACSDVVALDCDVKNSTFAEDFAKDEALAPRYFECRIAEQNMVSVAAALSVAGKCPYASTFGKFITRAYDQVEMAINSGANLKLVGSHIGVTLAADGPSQMGLPDVAWFRSLSTVESHKGGPACYVLTPSDAFQAYALTILMAEHDGPVYLRTMRPDTEVIYNDQAEFELGGHELLVEGRDLLIVASGYMVHEANKAIEVLDGEGIDASLVDLYSLPFNQEAILDLANANNGMILTIEDNYGGGIGSAVADAVSADGGGFNVRQLHVRRIPKSGTTTGHLLEYCGLSSEEIVKNALTLLQLPVS